MAWQICLYSFIALLGVAVGSFLNVCILRIPAGEDIVKTPSHCMRCGERLRWRDLVPIVSFLALRGRCRFCGAKLSWQYPLIEAANGILYVLIAWTAGPSVNSLLYCLMASALLVLSVIDFRTYEIPFGINLFLLGLGLIRVGTDFSHIYAYLAGFLSVSGFLAVLYYATGGRAIGGGDIKLMAACGLLLGWKLILLAFLLGCVAGSLIHPLRMKLSGQGRTLAMGPYLSLGVFISALWGERMLAWYFSRLL